MKQKCLLAALGVLLLIGCADSPAATSETAEVQPEAEVRPAPGTRPLPTLYPTATVLPPAEPTDTRPPEPTDVPDTPVAFDQVVVDLRYEIPGIGLDRRLRGNVSGLIEIIDEATGVVESRRNQPGVLFELQQALPEVTLEELPEECEFCVRLEYELPLADQEESGWLQDTQMLASLENYTAATLGPHFPPDTAVGLRRSATPYQVAHYVALTDDGQLFRWTATESELSGSEPAESDFVQLAEAMEDLELSSLIDSYGAECPQGTGVETLYFKLEDVERRIQIICPELSIPGKLLPTYLLLDGLAAEKLAGQGLPRPEPVVPVSSLLYFAREDGARMNLLTEGLAVAVDEGGVIYTGTITNSLTLSLTTELVDSGALVPGVDVFVLDETENILLVRDPDGFYSAGWDGRAAPGLEALIERLNGILDELVGIGSELPDDEETVTPKATGTLEATPTP